VLQLALPLPCTEGFVSVMRQIGCAKTVSFTDTLNGILGAGMESYRTSGHFGEL
jgi:hypothetical protein